MPSIAQSIRLVGDKELIATLESMKEAAARRIMLPALAAGIDEIYQAARQFAPSSSIRELITKQAFIPKRGRLKKGVIARVYVKPSGKRLILWRKKKGGFVDYGILGAFFEYGTRFMRPQPFLRPALATKKDAALARVTAVARDRGQKAAKRAAARARRMAARVAP